MRTLKWISICLPIFITCPNFGLAEEEKEKVIKLPEMVVIESQPGVEITPEKTIILMDEFKKLCCSLST